MDHGNAIVPSEINRVELDGEYDLARKEELSSLFAALPGDAAAVVDLSQVTYVDSTFLHELARLYFRLKLYGVTLTGANSSIRRVLGIVKFDELFRIVDS